MSKQKDGAWLQVRLTVEEKATLLELSERYGLTASAMVRVMSTYFQENKPEVTVRYAPKSKAEAA